MNAFNNKTSLLTLTIIFLLFGSGLFATRYFPAKKNSADIISKNQTTPSLPLSTEATRLLSEYQVAQLQRLIAENNEAVAVAKRNAAQATADTLKLLGAASANNSIKTNSEIKTVAVNPNNYELIYAGQQDDGKWIATLSKNGKKLDVSVGKRLGDGSQVVAIDEAGVLLTRGNSANKELITFSGEISSK